MRIVDKFEDVKAGDLGFYVGKGGISDVIEHITYSKALEELGFETPSHSLTFLHNDKCVEAVGKTRINDTYFYKKEFEAGRLYILRPSDEHTEVYGECAEAFAKSFKNYPYAWLQLVGFLPVVLMRKLGIKKFPNIFPWFTVCSEDCLIYLRIVLDYMERKAEESAEYTVIYSKEIQRLKWTKKLNKNTTDPALLMLHCLKDGNALKRLLMKHTPFA